MRCQRRLYALKLSPQPCALKRQKLLIANAVAITSRENLLLLRVRHCRRHNLAVLSKHFRLIDHFDRLVLVLPLVVAEKTVACSVQGETIL